MHDSLILARHKSLKMIQRYNLINARRQTLTVEQRESLNIARS
jgi:hypothetical protein